MLPIWFHAKSKYVWFPFSAYSFTQNYTLWTKQSELWNVCMSRRQASKAHVVSQRERLPGASSRSLLASPRLIKSNSPDHLFAQTTHQLCPTLHDFLQHSTASMQKTFLQTVHGRWDKMSLSHSSVQLCSGFLTHGPKSICVKRKTGLILAEPWLWTWKTYLLWLPIRELELRSVICANISRK